METRNQAVDREIVPQRLISLPSSDLKCTDALRWVPSLGWDRVQEDKNVGRGPHTEMALKWGPRGWLIKGYDSPSIQNPAPPCPRYRHRQLCSTVLWAVMGLPRG